MILSIPSLTLQIPCLLYCLRAVRSPPSWQVSQLSEAVKQRFAVGSQLRRVSLHSNSKGSSDNLSNSPAFCCLTCPEFEAMPGNTKVSHLKSLLSCTGRGRKILGFFKHDSRWCWSWTSESFIKKDQPGKTQPWASSRCQTSMAVETSPNYWIPIQVRTNPEVPIRLGLELWWSLSSLPLSAYKPREQLRGFDGRYLPGEKVYNLIWKFSIICHPGRVLWAPARRSRGLFHYWTQFFKQKL